ncbi:DgyrCDS12197 [Dimorphilus gyrociliatus]|uniref:DgyrCDS12197 n=1 Tax=Dimorphilus gyrociliatus TaxID=2664684 RepID=A0A7I8W7W4_9ANNE|nr:DgyrCDS12197 [Dimorphilus gyrociliatus]
MPPINDEVLSIIQYFIVLKKSNDLNNLSNSNDIVVEIVENRNPKLKYKYDIILSLENVRKFPLEDFGNFLRDPLLKLFRASKSLEKKGIDLEWSNFQKIIETGKVTAFENKDIRIETKQHSSIRNIMNHYLTFKVILKLTMDDIKPHILSDDLRKFFNASLIFGHNITYRINLHNHETYHFKSKAMKSSACYLKAAISRFRDFPNALNESALNFIGDKVRLKSPKIEEMFSELNNASSFKNVDSLKLQIYISPVQSEPPLPLPIYNCKKVQFTFLLGNCYVPYAASTANAPILKCLSIGPISLGNVLEDTPTTAIHYSFEALFRNETLYQEESAEEENYALQVVLVMLPLLKAHQFQRDYEIYEATRILNENFLNIIHLFQRKINELLAKIVRGIIIYPDDDPFEDQEKNELINHCAKMMAESIELSKYKRSCLDSMKDAPGHSICDKLRYCISAAERIQETTSNKKKRKRKFPKEISAVKKRRKSVSTRSSAISNEESDDEAIHFLGLDRSVQVLPSADKDSNEEIFIDSGQSTDIKQEIIDETSDDCFVIDKSLSVNNVFIDSNDFDLEPNETINSSKLDDIFVDSPPGSQVDDELRVSKKNIQTEDLLERESDFDDNCIHLQEVPVLECNDDILGSEKPLTEESGIGTDDNLFQEVPICSPIPDHSDETRELDLSEEFYETNNAIHDQSFQNYLEGALETSNDDNFENAFAYIIANLGENDEPESTSHKECEEESNELSDSQFFENSVDDINDLLTKR